MPVVQELGEQETEPPSLARGRPGWILRSLLLVNWCAGVGAGLVQGGRAEVGGGQEGGGLAAGLGGGGGCSC